MDDFLLFVEEPQVGTFTCTADSETCPIGAFLILGTTPTGSDAEAIYTSVGGTVNITSINEDRASEVGTFMDPLVEFSLTRRVACLLIDHVTKAQVAEWRGTLDAHDLRMLTLATALYYNEAWIGVETTGGWGLPIVVLHRWDGEQAVVA